MSLSTNTGSVDAAVAARPTRARYGVIGFAASVAALTYIDRVCISQAEPFITKEFKLTPSRWAGPSPRRGYALSSKSRRLAGGPSARGRCSRARPVVSFSCRRHGLA
jgi:hypothetical protein